MVVPLPPLQGHVHAGVAVHAKKNFCARKLSATIQKALAMHVSALVLPTMAVTGATILAWRDSPAR